MDEMKLPDGKQSQLRIYSQWAVWALVRIAAIPKAGPAVDQHLGVYFLLEQPKKPTAEQIELEVREKVPAEEFELKRVDIYQTSRAAFVPIKREESPSPAPRDPDTE